MVVRNGLGLRVEISRAAILRVNVLLLVRDNFDKFALFDDRGTLCFEPCLHSLFEVLILKGIRVNYWKLFS